MNQHLPIQVYYATQGQELTAEKSFHVTEKKGSRFAVIELESAAYTQIRLDMDGSFVLNSISRTRQHPVIDYGRTVPDIGVHFFAAWCLSFMVFILLGGISEPTSRTKKYFQVPHAFFSNLMQEKSKWGFIALELFLTSNILQTVCLYKPVQQDSLNGELFPVSAIAVLGICVMSMILWHFGRANDRKLTLFLSMIVFLSTVAAIRLSVQINARLVLYAAAMAAVWIVGPLLFEKDDVHAIVSQVKPHVPRLILAVLLTIAACGLGVLYEFIYSTYTKEGWIWGRMLLFFVIALIILAFAAFHRALIEKPEKFFLLIALPVGLYMCVILPTASVSWDEQIHYARTVYFSQSSSAVFTEADMSINQIRASSSLSESAKQNNRDALQHQYLEGDDQIREDTRAMSLPRVGYLPSAMGLWLGKILNAPFSVVFILGRMGNFLFYAISIYYAIKKLKNGKILLLIIGLLPTNLFLASCYSYDPWVTALTALGFSYFLSALQRPDEKLTYRECAVMMGALLLASLPKLVYLVLIVILLAMPREKFSNSTAQKKYRTAVCICVIAVFAYFLQRYFLSSSLSNLTDIRGGAAVNAKEQFIYVFSHPLSYAGTLLKFLYGYIHPENSASYMTFFAYLGATGQHTLLYIMLCVAALTDYQTEGLERSPYLRIFSAAILFITVAAIASALYISFTPVGHSTINGCQPRYLLPLIFPFFGLSFGHFKEENVNWVAYRMTFYVLNFYSVISTVWLIIVPKMTL